MGIGPGPPSRGAGYARLYTLIMKNIYTLVIMLQLVAKLYERPAQKEFSYIVSISYWCMSSSQCSLQ